MGKIRNKIISVFLVLVLLCSGVPSAAWAADEVIAITTADDLLWLSQACSVDGWSRDKQVLLEADIDLTGTAFKTIPTFGGVFDGQGHAITGLAVIGSGNVRGLFRYIQPGGVVKNLNLSGSVTPADRQDVAGGLAGQNSGHILNCTFTGVVAGGDTVGGLVGRNEASGQVVNSVFAGSVSGEHQVGGVAGENGGSLIQCENRGSINTTAVEATVNLQAMERFSLNAAENLPASTDIGGIAGFSNGLIQSCHNTGSVGYEHLGYNVGGIAGRQSGYLDGCTNSGLIQGRKDVGGIAGQMEPQLTPKYTQEELGSLWDELDTLERLLDKALSDAQSASGTISGEVKALHAQAASVQSSALDLSEAMGDWTEESVAELEEVSARLAWSMTQLEPVLENGEKGFEQLAIALGQWENALEEVEKSFPLEESAAQELRSALADAQNAVQQGEKALEHLQAAVALLKQSLGDEEAVALALTQMSQANRELAEAFAKLAASIRVIAQTLGGQDFGLSEETETIIEQELDTIAQNLQAVQQALQKINAVLNDLMRAPDPETIDEVLAELKAAISDWSEAQTLMSQATEQLSAAAKEALRELAETGSATESYFLRAARAMDKASAALEQAARQFNHLVQELAEQPAISIKPLKSSVSSEEAVLEETVADLLAQASTLTEIMAEDSQVLLADLRLVNRQLSVIVDLLRQNAEEKEGLAWQDYFEDISDQQIAAEDGAGQISHCHNSGAVKGDINVAGIVGAMAMEYDFDLEDDWRMDGDGSRLAGRCYQAKALVTESLNEGAITAKKNNVGGIVGRMDLGSIVACEGYGSVSSTSGDYVGGVAGFSAAVIRQSWAKCTLEGNAYVGGIAGFGSRISDCHTCVELKKGTAYLGAVAGDMDTDGELAGNSFVQESVGGVDEISYCGKAEPVSFETLQAMGNIPERFMQFELTFLAKGELVARIPFQYGEALEALPDIPLQKGYSAQWPAIDYQYLTFSQTLEAQYLPYRSALSTEAETPQILVDGSFSSEAEILQTAFPAQWTDAAGKVYSGMAYTVALEDPLLPNSSLTIHYKLSGNSKRYTLWVQKEAGWESQEFETDGSYLLWRAVDNPTTFCVIEQKRHWLPVIFLTAAGGVLLFWLWKKISAIR